MSNSHQNQDHHAANTQNLGPGDIEEAKKLRGAFDNIRMNLPR